MRKAVKKVQDQLVKEDLKDETQAHTKTKEKLTAAMKELQTLRAKDDAVNPEELKNAHEIERIRERAYVNVYAC